MKPNSKKVQRIAIWVQEAEEYRKTVCKKDCYQCSKQGRCGIPTLKNVYDALRY